MNLQLFADGGMDSLNSGVRLTSANPLENIRYSQKVLNQMQLGDYHSFPLSVDGFGAYGRISEIIGGDGIRRTLVQIDGSWRDKIGVFEYIIEPDGIVNHRLFVPR